MNSMATLTINRAEYFRLRESIGIRLDRIVAERAGISSSHLSRILSQEDISSVTVGTILLICKVLGCKMEDLLCESE